MFKSEKGITLVALVVTVIVLIILAAVTITLVLGQNGIITRTQQGAQNYTNAQRDENTMLNQAIDDMDNLVNSVTNP